MRKPIYAMLLAFALGGFAPFAAQAGEGCAWSGHSVKQNDVETPPPAASVTKSQTQS